MLTYNNTFPEFLLERANKTKTLERVVGQIFRESIREWLRAILRSVPSRGGFPVLTGAAKSTLKPLGRYLRVAIPITPVPDDKGKYIDGRAKGEASQFFKIIDDKTNPGQYTFEFDWSTDLVHYEINEQYPVIKSAPWHTLDAGDAAFNRHLEESLRRRLPKIMEDLGF